MPSDAMETARKAEQKAQRKAHKNARRASPKNQQMQPAPTTTDALNEEPFDLVTTDPVAILLPRGPLTEDGVDPPICVSAGQ